MINIKAVVRTPRRDGMYIVYIRFTVARKIQYLKTSWLVDAKGLTRSKEIKDAFVLSNVSDRIKMYYDLLNQMDTEGWSCAEVVEYLTTANGDVSFSETARDYYWSLKEQGRDRTAKNYRATLLSLEKFADSDSIMFSRLTTAFLQRWIDSLSGTARAKEQYPVCARQIFKYARNKYNDEERGIIRVPFPWGKIKIPTADTPDKRALPASLIRKFFAYIPDRSRFTHPLQAEGQDVCKMVFCLAGINTVDLYNLKKTDYYDGIIHYNRCKERNVRSDNGYFEIRVPGILSTLFDRYLDRTDSPWLFNFHCRLTTSDSFCVNVNSGIRQICKNLGLEKEQYFSAYAFRHSWATIAQNECGATLADVDFGLNHSRNKMAKVYVKIDFTPAWELNEKVIDFVFFTDMESSIVHEDIRKTFERFSVKHLMHATAHYLGKVVAEVEDIGFNNIDEIMDYLMKRIPDDVPKHALIQFKITNEDKEQTQYYEKQRI